MLSFSWLLIKNLSNQTFIIKFLGYPRQTVHDLKKWFEAEVAAAAKGSDGTGEPLPARKVNNRKDAQTTIVRPRLLVKSKSSKIIKIMIYDDFVLIS